MFRNGRGGRRGGRCGTEVRGGPAAAWCGGLNQQVSRSAAGEGRPGLPPPPHAARRARQDPRLLCGLPQAAGAAAGRGGCELNLCPLEELCLAVPTPSVLARDPPWRGSCPSGPSCRGRGRVSPVLRTLVPEFGTPRTPSRPGRENRRGEHFPLEDGM